MKGSDMALLAALGIGGYYLLSKGKDNQQVLPGVSGGSPINLDLSGLLGGIGGLGGGGGVSMPDLSGLSPMLQGIFDTVNQQAGSLLSGVNQQAQGIFDTVNQQAGSLLIGVNQQAQGILDAANAQAAGLLDAARGVSDGLNADQGVVEGAGEVIGGLLSSGGSATPNGFPPPGGSKANWQGIKERSAGDFMGIGAAWVGKLTIPMFIRSVAPKVAVSAGGKLALAGTGIGVPLAIAWTGADILTTVYELATDKDIPIVGFGELFRVTQQEKNTGVDSSKGQIPEKAIAQKETRPSPTRESPTRAEALFRLPSYEERFGEKPISEYGLIEHTAPASRKFTDTYSEADYNADIRLLNKNLTPDQQRILGLI